VTAMVSWHPSASAANYHDRAWRQSFSTLRRQPDSGNGRQRRFLLLSHLTVTGGLAVPSDLIPKAALISDCGKVQRPPRIRTPLSVFSNEEAYLIREQSPRVPVLATNTRWGLTSSDKELLPAHLPPHVCPGGSPSTKRDAKPTNLRHSTFCVR
jgi:hypothetical protein